MQCIRSLLEFEVKQTARLRDSDKSKYQVPVSAKVSDSQYRISESRKSRKER